MTIDPPARPRTIFLTPGTLYCSANPAIISTVLGSCVAVCLLDRRSRATGMNHFVLPTGPAGERSLRYGAIAIERLIDRMSELGCVSGDLRAKLFGGAAVLPFGDAGDTVGTKNVNIAIELLHRRSIPVTARRTGGHNGLLVRLHTVTGRIMVRPITSTAGTNGSARIPTHDFREGILAKAPVGEDF